MDLSVAGRSPRLEDESEPDIHLEPLDKIDSPSYPQLVDHTLGVVFSCYNNQHAEPFQLSSNQLNWATKFIEGHHPEKSPNLKHLSSYLQQISVALTTEESRNPKPSEDGVNEEEENSVEPATTPESNDICTELLGTLEQWRSEQLAELDRDFETLLAIEKMLLDCDFDGEI